MVITRTFGAQQRISDRWRRAGLRVGFVPTMGALHVGHLSLVAAARRECDRVVTSIFVNPIQFGPKEDLQRYPRPFAADRAALVHAGCAALFAPTVRTMYPPGFATAVEVSGPLTRRLCAPHRPGHFRGVATVVARLLAITRPHRLYVGQKDAQQAAILRRMVADLGFDVSVSVQPIVREADGLALSSRNRYLGPADRAAAPVLARALRAGAAAARAGARRRSAVLTVMRRVLASEPRVRVQYLDIVNARTLEPAPRLRGRQLLAVAAFVGSTRLIDNVTVALPA